MRHLSISRLLVGFLSVLPACATTVVSATGSSPDATPSPAPQTHDVAAFKIPPVGTAAPERFFNLFHPFRTEAATLSPDGRRLAYAVREDENLYVAVVDVDDHAKLQLKILVGTTDSSTPALDRYHLTEKNPARIRWMGWATSNRLLIETNASLATSPGDGWINTSGAIFGVNADGSDARTLVTPRDVTAPPAFGPALQSQHPDRIFRPDEDPDEGSQPLDDVVIDNTDNNLPKDVRSPRSPSFFDYTPGDLDSITVRTTDSRNYSLYRINIFSGKMDFGKNEMSIEQIHPLPNRQGLIGAAIPKTLSTGFPHSFLVQKSGFSFGRWNKLSNVAKIQSVDFTLSPDNYIGERSFPLGFDENPDILYYASNVGRDTYGIYGLNLKTGQPVGKPIESPQIDLVDAAPNGFPSPSPLVFDRYTRELVGVRYQSSIRTAVWLRPDLQEAQTMLESTFPGRSVDITGWDEVGNRFLAIVRGPTDPGGFYIVDRAARKAYEFVRRAAAADSSERPITRYVSLDNPAGGTLTGVVAIPRAVRQKPIPIVVLCADEPWLRTPTEFDSEMNALSQMGFAVLQINPRGTWGHGVKHREAAAAAFDEIQSADILTAIDLLSKSMPLNPKRVAIMGRERGGYLALRSVQLHPDRFRCVVALNPTVDLKSWLNESRWTDGSSAPALTRTFFGETLLRQNALMDGDNPVGKPAFVLAYRGIDGTPSSQHYLNARSFARRTRNAGTHVRFWDLSSDHTAGMPAARSEVMRNIEDFLNEHIYAYNVQMGETDVLEDHPKRPSHKK